MANSLYLVRYPAIQTDLSKPSSYWSLSEFGERQTRRLAELAWWSEVATIYTNTEEKAITATEIITARHPHLKRHALPGFSETQRSMESLPEEEYRRCARAFFAHPDKPAFFGWATSGVVRHLVVDTFHDIVSQLKQNTQSGAIIAHGMALTLLRGHLLGQHATYEDLRKIPCGSWAIIDVATAHMVQDFQPIEAEPSAIPDYRTQGS